MDFVALAGMAMVTVLCFPIVRAVVRRVERKGDAAGDAQLRVEVEELRAQVEGMTELRDRVLELEERVDFTERMLTRGREPGPLDEPS